MILYVRALIRLMTFARGTPSRSAQSEELRSCDRVGRPSKRSGPSVAVRNRRRLRHSMSLINPKRTVLAAQRKH